MIKDFVSILIVTHNCERYIANTLLSCQNQTYRNFEILILDNDSTDKTTQIIEEIKCKNLKLFKSTENIGPFCGLNFLLERSSGEYVAIQDHDDIWFDDKIERQILFMEKNHEVIACGASTFYFYEYNKKFILNKRKFLIDCVDHTSLFFRNNGFRYDEKNVLSDEHFQKVILKKAGGIHCIEQPLVVHRIREDGNNYSAKRIRFTLKEINEIIALNGVNMRNLVFFMVILANKFLPLEFAYNLAFKIFRKNLVQLTEEDFQKKYPNSNFKARMAIN